MPPSRGYPIVLTADRTLMADYRLLFDGMLAASQTSTIPPALLAGLLMPRPPHSKGVCAVAPLGLRRIEAALIAGGFEPGDIAVVDMYHLGDAIGPDTRVIGVTSGEPVGLGMNSSTMTEIAGGRIYPEVMFDQLMRRVRERVADTGGAAKVVLGGPGAWQLARDSASMKSLGVDHLVTGYAEGNVARVFRALIDGEDLPKVIPGEPVPPENVPRVRGASTMGVVEISRGCGLGCEFCTISDVRMIHLPESTIIADAQTNIAAGNTSIAILSEDCFRYGATGLTPNPKALLSLLEKLRAIKGLRQIQVDHANVASVAHYSDDELCAARALMVGCYRNDYPWVNLGVETASGELLKANGGAPKMGRCAPGDWGDFCAEQVRRVCRAGFLPMVSLIMGLPGETEEDVQRTLDWVESIADERVTVFPMLLAPVDGGAPVRARDLTRLHWRLMRTCYRLNFKWIPRMYWHNQSGAGVPVSRRLLLQVMGKGQIVQWNALFALHGRRAKR